MVSFSTEVLSVRFLLSIMRRLLLARSLQRFFNLFCDFQCMLVYLFDIVSPVLFVNLIILWWVRAMRAVLGNRALVLLLLWLLLFVILRGFIGIDLPFFLLKVSLDAEASLRLGLALLNVSSAPFLVTLIRRYIVDKANNFFSFLYLLLNLFFLNFQLFLKLSFFEIVSPWRKQLILEHFIEYWWFFLVLLLDFEFFLQKNVFNVLVLKLFKLLF